MQRIVYSSKYSLYNLGDNHPFTPLRAEMTVDFLSSLNIGVEFCEPENITPEQLYEIHSRDYVDTVEKLSRGEDAADFEKFGLGTQDNPVMPGMAEGARNMCGGAVAGAKLIIEGKADKVLQLGGGFHHAQYGFASGFCLYNDIALAIKEFQKHNKHILYLDIDVHHGDGVQELFSSDDKVMTVSFHESGEYLFPGTGWIYELGKGMGRSLKLNIPLEPFTEGKSYIEVFDLILSAALPWFRPDALIIQSGSDAHFSDPLADLMLTTADYKIIFDKIFEYADKFAGGKALFLLGGGYSIQAAFRIWSILAMKIIGRKLPEKIPAEFRDKWKKKIGVNLPEYFDDILPCFKPIPRKPIVEKTNLDTARRLLDAVYPDWL